jgi:hypothetical protein
MKLILALLSILYDLNSIGIIQIKEKFNRPVTIVQKLLCDAGCYPLFTFVIKDDSFNHKEAHGVKAKGNQSKGKSDIAIQAFSGI